MDIPKLLQELDITPDPFKDQFFLIDETVPQAMVEAADLQPTDVVLEIGAGTGIITELLADKAKKVIAFEIEPKFQPVLAKLPSNVDLHLKDASNFKSNQYNKIVANLPFSFAEKFLHQLTLTKYDKVILLLPQKLVSKIDKHPIFSLFFKAKLLTKVSKTQFYPQPRTDSAVIELVKLPDPLYTHNLALYLCQFVYRYSKNKLKNSLREGIIKYYWQTQGLRLTKKQAKKVIDETGLTKQLLDSPPAVESYPLLTEKLTSLDL